MAKPNYDASGAIEVEPVVAPVSLTLTEFCSRLSETVRSPELIGGFEFHERTAGRVQSTAADFRQRYDEFINKPI